MSDIQKLENRTGEQADALGDNFIKWLDGAYAEEYAGKIAKYCNSHTNCETCIFFNGTCRLNRYPWDWDVQRDCFKV